MKVLPFDWSFKEDCQENYVSNSLLMLVTMIMYGTNIKNQKNYFSQPALSLSQLITYNSSGPRRQQTTVESRHSEQRETPLPFLSWNIDSLQDQISGFNWHTLQTWIICFIWPCARHVGRSSQLCHCPLWECWDSLPTSTEHWGVHYISSW